MHEHDTILSLLRVSGPTLPAKVAKSLRTDILLASAHLSELVSRAKVRISYLKIGGSPLYYLPGQEYQLYQFAAGNINPKDLDVLNKLKERKILRESSLDLLSKVALRSLKDFATPLKVTANGSSELFWKWYLLPEQETQETIRILLAPAQQPSMLPSVEQEQIKPEHPLREERQNTVEKSPLLTEQKSIHTDEGMRTDEPNEGEAVQGTAGIVGREEQQLLAKKPLFEKVKETIIRRRRSGVPDELSPRLDAFFKKLSIQADQKEVIRKNAELNLIVKVPSPIGIMTYFCKAKWKKRCDEKDVSSAYMEAQIKKLPLLFLYTDELTKKAEEMLASDAFENVITKKMEQ